MTKYFINSPLDQFNIQPLFILETVLGGEKYQFTNFVLFFIIIFLTILGISFIGMYSQKIVANRWGISQESLFTTIQEMVYSQIGGSKGQYYLPLIYTLFIVILISNLLSMIPYSFAVTSHLVYTISLSVVIFLGVTILGASIHLQEFFGLFVPQGCPLALVPLLVFIELLSYLARSVSLGLRLGANILSGHMLMVILGGFIYNIMSSGIIYFIIGFIPLTVVFGIMGLEFAIAAIQAYVFSILACSYIKEALYLH
jgi:F-type H+-transporting ATPase subunit a